MNVRFSGASAYCDGVTYWWAFFTVVSEDHLRPFGHQVRCYNGVLRASFILQLQFAAQEGSRAASSHPLNVVDAVRSSVQ